MTRATRVTEDPIVEEVRRRRQARAAKFDYDIDAIADDARKRQEGGGHKVIQPPKRKAGRRRTDARGPSAG